MSLFYFILSNFHILKYSSIVCVVSTSIPTIVLRHIVRSHDFFIYPTSKYTSRRGRVLFWRKNVLQRLLYYTKLRNRYFIQHVKKNNSTRVGDDPVQSTLSNFKRGSEVDVDGSETEGPDISGFVTNGTCERFSTFGVNVDLCQIHVLIINEQKAHLNAFVCLFDVWTCINTVEPVLKSF